jgi:hypothetical protein
MRELILREIEYYKSRDGFSKSQMRWKNVYFNKEHISEIDFNSLSDEGLLDAFTHIVRRFYTQM